MTDEIGAVPESAQPEASPDLLNLDPQQVAQFLGIDPAYLDTVKENASNAEALLKKAQQEKSRTARERAEMLREIEEAKQGKPAEDTDEDNLTEEARKVLDKYIERKLEPLKKEQERNRQREIEKVVTDFENAHPKADLDAIGEYLQDIGASPQTPAQLKKAMAAAYTALFDDPAEKVRKELEKAKGKDGTIVEIKGKGKPVEDTRPGYARAGTVPLAELRRELLQKRKR